MRFSAIDGEAQLRDTTKEPRGENQANKEISESSFGRKKTRLIGGLELFDANLEILAQVCTLSRTRQKIVQK